MSKHFGKGILIRFEARGQSESALARACGVTRPAVREALDHLELCGLVNRPAVQGKRARKIELVKGKVTLVA